MPRNDERSSPRRRRDSSSPEPPRRQRSDARDARSRSHEPYKRRKYSSSPERPRRRRSKSPESPKIRSRYRSRSPRPSRRSRSKSPRRRSDHRSSKYDRDDRPRRTSYSPPPKRSPVRSSRALASQQDAFNGEVDGPPAIEKQKPNFAPTGRLATESNTIKSATGKAIVLKYHEPSESRKPPASQAWRMYVFKDDAIVDTVPLWERSCWLMGREPTIIDYLLEHTSCSKQHAVVQFRYIEKKNEFGDRKGKVRPYVIDLESANGTQLNGTAIEAGRYIELRDKDVLKFGHSTREFVVQLPPI